MMGRLWLSLSGRGLIVIGVFVLFFPFLFFSYSNYAFHATQTQMESQVETKKMSNEETIPVHSFSVLDTESEPSSNPEEPSMSIVYASGLYPESVPDLPVLPARGQNIGKLSIPSLSIAESIIEGTGELELAKAPGHLSDSVLPGQIGTSVIAAHNVTTFRHIDQLLEGTEFTVTTKQGKFTFQVVGQRILKVGDSLSNTSYPSVALETCYPLDALYLTDKRLFVEAALVKSELNVQ